MLGSILLFALLWQVHRFWPSKPWQLKTLINRPCAPWRGTSDRGVEG